MNTAKRGRPCTYSQKSDEVCTRLAEGESLAAICAEPYMPPRPTVLEWVKDNRGSDENGRDGFADRYARARQTGYELLADELIAISDADYTGPDGFVDNAAVQQARLKSDNRKWLLSKLLSARYGDRIVQEITGDGGGAVVTRILLEGVPARRLEASTIEQKDTIVSPVLAVG